MVRMSSRRSPFDLRKSLAMRLTREGGGSSATKRWASFKEMKWAVAGECGEDFQDFEAVVHSAAGGNYVAKDDLLAFVVDAVAVFEVAALGGVGDGPAGEAAGDFDDVFLGIAAVDAEGMKFEEFAAVVFVEAALRFAVVPGSSRSGGNGGGVIEIKEHGGALGGGEQEIVELAEDMRADGFAFVGGQQIAVCAFIGEDVEVIEPEIVEDFGELAVAIDAAQEFGFAEIADDDVRGIEGEHQLAAERGGGEAQQFLALGTGEGPGEIGGFFGGDGGEDLALLIGGSGLERFNLRRGKDGGEVAMRGGIAGLDQTRPGVGDVGVVNGHGEGWEGRQAGGASRDFRGSRRDGAAGRSIFSNRSGG